MQKELGNRKKDSDYIIERKAQTSTTTSIWRLLAGDKRYQDVTNAVTKDNPIDPSRKKDEYSIQSLVERSKNYRDQMKFYLDSIPGTENNKKWNLLNRRMERLKILLQQWIDYFTKKPTTSDARKSILNDLNKTITKLTNDKEQSSKEIKDQEKLKEQVSKMDNLKEIEDFVKDWSKLKITSKLIHSIKNGGASALFRMAISGITRFLCGRL